jgi:hypothetical protein
MEIAVTNRADLVCTQLYRAVGSLFPGEPSFLPGRTEVEVQDHSIPFICEVGGQEIGYSSGRSIFGGMDMAISGGGIFSVIFGGLIYLAILSVILYLVVRAYRRALNLLSRVAVSCEEIQKELQQIRDQICQDG